MSNQNRPSLIANAVGVLVLGAPALALLVMFWPASLEVGKTVLTYVLAGLFYAGLTYSPAFRVFFLASLVALFQFVGFALNGVYGAALLALTAFGGVLAWRNMKHRRLDLLLAWLLFAILFVLCGTMTFVESGARGLASLVVGMAVVFGISILLLKLVSAAKRQVGRRKLAAETGREWRRGMAIARSAGATRGEGEAQEISADEFLLGRGQRKHGG